MINIADHLHRIKQQADGALQIINGSVELSKNLELHSLITLLRQMDVNYEQYCNDIDSELGQTEGQTYSNEFGPSMEYYIEADDWHEISLALRNLAKAKQ